MKVYRFQLSQAKKELLWSTLPHVDHTQVGVRDFQQIEHRLRQPVIELTDREVAVLIKALDAYIQYAEAWSDDWARVREHQEARVEFMMILQRSLAVVDDKSQL